MPINEELLAFANGRAPWQRDCFRRICTQPDLTPSDFQEIFTNLKSTAGLERAGQIQHLNASHLINRTEISHGSTVLSSIGNVKNTNRLASNQTLLFAEQGITLIYGYNGSGKTGYGRILKNVCRTRHEKQDPILGDAYDSGTRPPASAQIEYKSGGISKTFAWIDGSNSSDELRLISVFDSTTAPLYADKQNKIEFLPIGLDVLPRLGEVCERLTAEIDTQVRATDEKIRAPLPKVESSRFSQFLTRLSGDAAAQMPTKDEIEGLFTWTSANEGELRTIQEEIRKLSEPAAQSAHLARLIGSIQGLRPKLESALSAVGPEVVAETQRKIANAKAAREAATIAAKGRFTNDPLGEAPATAAWRKLYESAEAFNAEIYPDDEFPATGPDRVCLLCQQSISEAAHERFGRFKEFLRDATQSDALHAEQELAALLRSVSAAVVPTAHEVDQQLQELIDTKSEHANLRNAIGQQCVALASSKSELSRCLQSGARLSDLPTVESAILSEIDNAISSLMSEKQLFDAQTKDFEALDSLKVRHSELLDQKNCASNSMIFLARRNDLSQREAWKSCRDQCETASISRKNSNLRDKYLTAEFRQAVLKEARYLGLDYLPLKVEGKTERGVGYIGVALSKTGREPTARILSEGEFRGLALACFFAEIGSIAGHDGIVVDDPVSSLDHLHVERVARRLVQEAKMRQVIVFTHDLAFYYDVYVAAAEANIPIHRNWIRKHGPSGFGYISSNDGPWQVKNTRERLATLEQLIKDMPDQATTPPDAYLKRTEEFYSKLRETWERLVEECLLNDVVGRFQPGVSTQKLRAVNVTDEDHRKVFFAMKKASEFSGHDRAVGRPPLARSRDEMKNDRGELWDYERELRTRKNNLDSARRALENPQTAQVTPPPKVGAPSLAS